MSQTPQQPENQSHEGEKPSALVAPSNLPIAYFNMPKSACTTIKNILYRIQHGTWSGDPIAIHRQIRYDDVLLRGQAFSAYRRTAHFDRPYIVFTFVRDPSPRAYSAFVEKVWATGPYAFPRVRQLLARSYGFTLPPLGEQEVTREQVAAGFGQFLRFVSKNLSGKTRVPENAHWAVQSKRILASRLHDLVGFVGRVENFAEDMSFVLRRAGWEDLTITAQRFNEGPRSPFTLDEILNAESAQLLTRIYREDYSAFDYRPPGRERARTRA